jgi:cell division protein FtsB
VKWHYNIHDTARHDADTDDRDTDGSDDGAEGSGDGGFSGKWARLRRFRPQDWVNSPARAIALAMLLVLVVLFGRDVLSSWHLRSEIGELQRRKLELQESLRADSILLRNLDDPEFLERYARERYLMREPGETVFILD